MLQERNDSGFIFEFFGMNSFVSKNGILKKDIQKKFIVSTPVPRDIPLRDFPFGTKRCSGLEWTNTSKLKLKRKYFMKII